MARRHVKKGDKVEVTAGKYKGQRGRVLEVLIYEDPDKNRVRVEGLAVVKRHLKPKRDAQTPQGGIVEKLGSIHISNVSPIDPTSDKPTRVGITYLEKGRKVRIARRSLEVLADDNHVS